MRLRTKTIIFVCLFIIVASLFLPSRHEYFASPPMTPSLTTTAPATTTAPLTTTSFTSSTQTLTTSPTPTTTYVPTATKITQNIPGCIVQATKSTARNAGVYNYFTNKANSCILENVAGTCDKSNAQAYDASVVTKIGKNSADQCVVDFASGTNIDKVKSFYVK